MLSVHPLQSLTVYFSQEVRYFEEHYDIKTTLEKSVNENPYDIKSWLLLAKQIVSDSTKDTSDQNASKMENKALNVLSKALEANPHSEVRQLVFAKDLME